MHEVAITQNLVDTVLAHAAGERVSRVRVDVGRLCGVVPSAMRFCFELVTAGTDLEGAELVIEEPAGRGHCRRCEAELDLTDLILLCPCGSSDVDVVSGRELAVRSYEVV